MDHQVGSGYLDLTEAERRLVQVVGSGDQLDLAGRKYRAGDLIPADVMRRWGRSHTVRASVIRDILRGRLVGRPDPRGIRLRGARISGRLDLNYLTATIPLSLTDCLLPDGIVASSATLPALILRGSLLAHRDLPPLVARRLTTTVLDLSLATVTARCELAAVDLAGSELGLLDARGATLVNARGPAIYRQPRSTSGGTLAWSGFDEGSSPTAASRRPHMRRASARCSLRWRRASAGSWSMSHDAVTITGAGGSALTTDGLVVGQDQHLAAADRAAAGGSAAVLELPNYLRRAQASITGRSHGDEYRRAQAAGSTCDGLTYRALPAWA